MSTTIDIQDLLENVGDDSGQSSMIRTIKQQANIYQVFFDEEIGEPRKYRDLINLLYLASENDEFNFFMNTPGGQAASMVAIIEAIKGTDATVRAVLNGECHSAGSFIALNCHEIFVTDSAHMLVHTASYGYGGNSHMVQKHADFSTKQVNNLLDSTYTGFLTSAELASVKLGVEIWLDSKEISERLKTRMAHMKKIHGKKKKVEQPE